MMVLGITAHHLRIVDFKFIHNFIICDRLPDTENTGQLEPTIEEIPNPQ